MKAKSPEAVFFLALVLWNFPLCYAQTASFGLGAGVPLNNLLSASDDLSGSTLRFTFGPALWVGLPRGFGIDVELLYKRMDFGFASDPNRATVRRLELPLLLRYSFSRLPVHPWVHAGMSFNRVIAIDGANVCARPASGEELYCIEDKAAAQLRHSHTHGPVAGAGVRFAWGPVRMAPELRITRWVDRNFGTRDSPLRSALTQIELLLGVQF